MNYVKGIDVSKWQGEINWEKAKADGVDFVMIRAGYGQNNIDEKFKRNADECTRLGIPFGIYWFSYAYTEDMAIKEAQFAVEAVKSYKLDYPIAFDFEYDSVDYAKKKGVSITKTLASAMTRAFCNTVKAAGYTPMVYANPDYLSRYFDANIVKEYDVWLAQWPNSVNLDNPPAQATGIWQYTSKGSVDGISGNVDMNASYKSYTANSPWYAADFQWGVNNGITDGTRPDDAITRAETVVMLRRLYNLLKK